MRPTLPPPLPPLPVPPPGAAAKRAAAAPPTPNRRSGRQYQQQQDISHLLGFTLPSRAPPPPSGPRRSAKRSPGHGVFDKQRYVHQFRFVVKPDKGYTQHFADPDVHFCWEDILQVIVSTTSSLSSASTSTIDQPVQRDDHRGAIPTCPICLSEPTAARMTKCGHVYCYACLLHYLALADGTKWRKCPVCWDAIYAKDLKAVKWHDPAAASSLIQVSPSSLPIAPEEPHDPFDTTLPTEPLKMRLVRRPQLTTLALPRSSTWPSEAVPPLRAPWEFTPDVINYAKFMLGSPEYLRDALESDLRELEREIVELRSWGRAGGSDEELGIVFVRAAMGKVREQVEMVGGLRTPAVVGARRQALRELQEVQEVAGRDALVVELPVVSETSSSEVEEEVPAEFLASRGGAALSSSAAPFTPGTSTKARPQRRNVNPPPPDADTAYLFYQAASGQNIFLQPLDIRILKSHFGTYDALPDTIEVLVEGSDEGSMNEELRRRCRWLSHLPTACDVVFIEADLSRVVSKASLEPFAVALKQRRNKRRDKARREDKAKAKSEQKEADARPLYTTATYSPSSYDIPLPSTFSSSSFDEPHAFPPPTSRPPDVQPEHLTWNGSEATRTVWGTRSFATALHSSSRTLDSPDDPDFDERWLDFEDHLGGGGRGGGGRGGGGSAGGSNAGGGRAAEQVPKGKKKKKGVTLNLTAGAGGRGA